MSQSGIKEIYWNRIILYYYRPLYLPIGIMNLQNILCLKTIIAFPTDLINSENCYKIFQFKCDSNLYSLTISKFFWENNKCNRLTFKLFCTT